MYRKAFDKDLYNKHDNSTKQVVINYYTDDEFKLIENPYSEFGADLMVLKKIADNKYELDGWVEVERKLAPLWTKDTYGYPDIRIAARKLKFKGSHVVLVNKDASSMCLITPEVLESSPLTFEVNKYSEGKEELFISVDPEQCEFVFNLKGNPQ